jgi:hypothetical protein
LLSQEYFDSWNRRFMQAKANMNNREELVLQAVVELENEMELLGVTGVEGK